VYLLASLNKHSKYHFLTLQQTIFACVEFFSSADQKTLGFVPYQLSLHVNLSFDENSHVYFHNQCIKKKDVPQRQFVNSNLSISSRNVKFRFFILELLLLCERQNEMDNLLDRIVTFNWSFSNHGIQEREHMSSIYGIEKINQWKQISRRTFVNGNSNFHSIFFCFLCKMDTVFIQDLLATINQEHVREALEICVHW
jgi:hypothetical protein